MFCVCVQAVWSNLLWGLLSLEDDSAAGGARAPAAAAHVDQFHHQYDHFGGRQLSVCTVRCLAVC